MQKSSNKINHYFKNIKKEVKDKTETTKKGKDEENTTEIKTTNREYREKEKEETDLEKTTEKKNKEDEKKRNEEDEITEQTKIKEEHKRMEIALKTINNNTNSKEKEKKEETITDETTRTITERIRNAIKTIDDWNEYEEVRTIKDETTKDKKEEVRWNKLLDTWDDKKMREERIRTGKKMQKIKETTNEIEKETKRKRETREITPTAIQIISSIMLTNEEETQNRIKGDSEIPTQTVKEDKISKTEREHETETAERSTDNNIVQEKIERNKEEKETHDEENNNEEKAKQIKETKETTSKEGKQLKPKDQQHQQQQSNKRKNLETEKNNKTSKTKHRTKKSEESSVTRTYIKSGGKELIELDTVKTDIEKATKTVTSARNGTDSEVEPPNSETREATLRRDAKLEITSERKLEEVTDSNRTWPVP